MFLFQTPRHYGRKWEAPRHRGPARAVSPSTWINDRATGCRNPPPPIEPPPRHGSNDQPQSVTRGAQSASGAAAGGTAHSRPCTKPRTPANRRRRRTGNAQPALHEAQDGPANTLWPAAPPEHGEPHWGRKTLIGVGKSPTPMTCCLPRCGGRARWARRLVGSATGRKGPVPPMRWPVPWRARSGFLPCSDSGNRRGPSRPPCSRRGWPPGARGLPAPGRRRAPAGRWGRVAA